MNDLNFYLDMAEESMKEAIAFLDDSLAHIRAGKANVKILDPIRVDDYGAKVPIGNVANISTPDQRTIAIQPWEKNMWLSSTATSVSCPSTTERSSASTSHP